MGKEFYNKQFESLLDSCKISFSTSNKPKVSIIVSATPPADYELKDFAGVMFQGSFYESCKKSFLIKTKFYDRKILSRKTVGRRTVVLVKWLCWPNRFTSWIS